MRPASLFPLICLASSIAAAEPAKQSSAFYPPPMVARATANARKYPWAEAMRKRIVAQAQPWMKSSDRELWDLMFGSTLLRSHHVWSAGYCPACRKPVPMYDWQIDGLERPWKVRCPHCREMFPKNDFQKFYKSGLDPHGVFDPKLADRSLLFNTEHADASDPLHRFGVDDGTGYEQDGHRWYFTGAYLLYGQWWQAVLGGIAKLSAAHAATGDPVYAHKAAILLDRVADVFPTFDYGEQGLVYELKKYGGGFAGYVSYSIDSAYDVRKLTLAYDQVFDAIGRDAELVRFLSGEAARHGLANPKRTAADIRRNIEQRILIDALEHPDKTRTNPPGREGTFTLIKSVLGRPREEVMADIDKIVGDATAVEGLTGEKGINGYTSLGPHFLASFLEMYARVDPGLLGQMLERHPNLRKTYRFFVDTWINRQYYPSAGDAGAFAVRDTHYAGLQFDPGDGTGKMDTAPPVSMYSFLWHFWKATKDPLYLQLLRMGNGGSVENLPRDLYAEDPAALVRDVERVVAEAGPYPKPGSVDKNEFDIAILRSRRDPAEAVVLKYDSIPNSKIKGHWHFDSMNLELFAKGLDLLPEFGYPAVQFGSWHTPQALWHRMTAAHNTVVVDGKDQVGGEAKSTLWADGAAFRAVRASSPAQIRGSQYERTAAMVDLPGGGFYVLDVFRVNGGKDHAKFTHGYFGQLASEGLRLEPAPDYGNKTLTRNFREDPHPPAAWSVDWKAEDRLHYLAPGSDVHLRYTDLTSDAQAYLCESWTVRNANSTEEFWIPTVMVRRQSAEAPLASTFVGVLEPYEGRRATGAIRRLPASAGDANVAVEVALAGGGTDLLLASDADHFKGELSAGDVRLSGELALVRRGASGKVERIALCRGDSLRAGGVEVRLKRKVDYFEAAVEAGRVRIESGNPEDVAEIKGL